MNRDLKLIINLHRSPLLADAVRSALQKSGRFVDVSHIEYAMDQLAACSNGKDAVVSLDPNTSGHCWGDFYARNGYSDYTFIDAATEFGKLVALLEKPEPKVIEWLAGGLRDGDKSYDGHVAEDGSGISVGCSF